MNDHFMPSITVKSIFLIPLSMFHIVFVDVTHPKAYDYTTLENEGLGGTEASVLRTAKILTQHYKVSIYQAHGHNQMNTAHGVRFLSRSDWRNLSSPDVVVLLRKFKSVKTLRLRFPKSRIYLWIHTYKNWEYAFKKITLSARKLTFLCNSNTHAKHTNNLLNQSVFAKILSLFSEKHKVAYVYNPIPVLQPLAVTRDVNKLLFLSSPNKGLDEVIRCFNWLHLQNPNLTLYIANPGYRPDATITDHPNIKLLGSISHEQVLQHLASSLCLFYPQKSFAETFGLIYAEANGLGTPVIAHDIGSAREILHTNNPLIEADNYQQILDTISDWQNQLPQVSYNKDFNQASILSQWKQLLTET